MNLLNLAETKIADQDEFRRAADARKYQGTTLRNIVAVDLIGNELSELPGWTAVNRLAPEVRPLFDFDVNDRGSIGQPPWVRRGARSRPDNFHRCAAVEWDQADLPRRIRTLLIPTGNERAIR